MGSVGAARCARSSSSARVGSGRTPSPRLTASMRVTAPRTPSPSSSASVFISATRSTCSSEAMARSEASLVGSAERAARNASIARAGSPPRSATIAAAIAPAARSSPEPRAAPHASRARLTSSVRPPRAAISSASARVSGGGCSPRDFSVDSMSSGRPEEPSRRPSATRVFDGSPPAVRWARARTCAARSSSGVIVERAASAAARGCIPGALAAASR